MSEKTFNILGINPGHNGSAALLVNGQTTYYCEEERLSRNKYDGNPFRAINQIINSGQHIDVVVVAGTTEPVKLPWTGEDPYTALVRKYNPEVKTAHMHHEHHMTHASCAFYNSGFDEAFAFVIDGAGSIKQISDEVPNINGFEAESAWLCSYPKKFLLLDRAHGANNAEYFETFDKSSRLTDSVTITKAYEAVTEYLGFGYIEAGKTMGLASYGEEDSRLPWLLDKQGANKNVFIRNYPAGAVIDVRRNPILKQPGDPKRWHRDSSKLTKVEKNLAYKIQNESQKKVGDYIESIIEKFGQLSKCRNIVIAGGYGLNCVANYYLAKRFPLFTFYFEPIAHDGGTAIGAAKLAWYSYLEYMGKEDNDRRVQLNINYGAAYNPEEIINVVNSEAERGNIDVKNITYSEVAELISEKNIVALYQGRAEAGPRALGNRSILYDPRDPDGKEFVNTIKGREWFRPFAGSVLEEDGKDWFDLEPMKISPFMMYAVNVKSEKISEIPSIVHVDNTCRVQTVSEEQNVHYYNLIKSFKTLTGVPILFNTSFNLAGEPLVETVLDALSTLYRSKLKYLYLPEHGILITKKMSDPVDEPVESDTSDDEI